MSLAATLGAFVAGLDPAKVPPQVLEKARAGIGAVLEAFAALPRQALA